MLPTNRYTSTPTERQRPRKYLKPWLFGVIAGTIFVLGEVLFKIAPPSAYAFCLSCHTRDLVNTIVNAVFGKNFQTALIARRVIMVTSPGVLLGAFAAARLTGEHRVQTSDQPARFFLIGFAVMIIGLVIFGCPTRIVIRAGYGEFYGLVALVGMFLGILTGTLLLKLRWSRRL